MAGQQMHEVNHWRGQCLDNFSRVEQAVIIFIERWRDAAPETAPALAESATVRSRNLQTALQEMKSGDPGLKQIVKLLSLWAYRERDRNDLVHGVFTVKTSGGRWAVINKTMPVKKQVSSVREDLKSACEADAFLAAIVSERKAIETALKAFENFS